MSRLSKKDFEHAVAHLSIVFKNNFFSTYYNKNPKEEKDLFMPQTGGKDNLTHDLLLNYICPQITRNQERMLNNLTLELVTKYNNNTPYQSDVSCYVININKFLKVIDDLEIELHPRFNRSPSERKN